MWVEETATTSQTLSQAECRDTVRLGEQLSMIPVPIRDFVEKLSKSGPIPPDADRAVRLLLTCSPIHLVPVVWRRMAFTLVSVVVAKKASRRANARVVRVIDGLDEGIGDAALEHLENLLHRDDDVPTAAELPLEQKVSTLLQPDQTVLDEELSLLKLSEDRVVVGSV